MTTQFICTLNDIIPEGGVCALIGGKQVAIFRTKDDKVFALDNFDPFSKANVLSRGLIGGTMIKTQLEDGTVSENEVLYIASPIYKQRFDLATGLCLDDEAVKIDSYEVSLEGDQIMVSVKESMAA
ncbi:nitrite reductase (NAD(P)H) small subunit family protein [Psychrobacter sp.]|uniref:nitrite reductase (NAD(P)H) small subunit family protein n=1 Tax=Psychrobacter sp. TaxID=56811 RepID=UPI0025E9047E|nr:nitrite reductase (NAD(P)H) small subunit family protein [Psychrobacter sp.]